jgi:hypothetical protein
VSIKWGREEPGTPSPRWTRNTAIGFSPIRRKKLQFANSAGRGRLHMSIDALRTVGAYR